MFHINEPYGGVIYSNVSIRVEAEFKYLDSQQMSICVSTYYAFGLCK